MNTYHYLFETAIERYICVTPIEVVIRRETEEFFRLMKLQEYYELKPQGIPEIIFREVSELEIVPQNAVSIEFREYWKEGNLQKVFFRSDKGKSPFVEMIWENNRPVRCLYTAKGRNEISFSNRLIDFLSMETLLLNQGGFLLHCCLVNWNGKGILFSAPSGTGKSTQGELWVKHQGAEIINGDRAGLVREKGRWMACGLPYAGSSNEYLNKKVPVHAIVYLSQNDENVIAEMTPSQILKKLYPEITIHHWDREFVEQATETLISMIGDIRFYHLSCRPDQEAVDILKEVITL